VWVTPPAQNKTDIGEQRRDPLTPILPIGDETVHLERFGDDRPTVMRGLSAL
jgi:hypothetical protein